MEGEDIKVVWHEETVPKQWREGLIVNLFKKGDKEDPGNYRGITLLSMVGKVFCKVINNSTWIVVVNCMKGKQDFVLERVAWIMLKLCRVD